MMTRITKSWYLRTLIGKLVTALAATIILLGVAGGIIYALATALTATHQSQAICQLAHDLGTGQPAAATANTPATSPLGLKFITDGRNAYRVGNCQDVLGKLPALTKIQKELLPKGTK